MSTTTTTSPDNPNLSHCAACQGLVSKSAKTCPHCGENKPHAQPKKSGSHVFWWAILGFFLCLAVPQMIVPIAREEAANRPKGQNAENSEFDAQKLCIQAITASVNNPSTLDIDLLTGYSSQKLANGTTQAYQSFSAKNAFGLERKYEALCEISAKGKVKLKVREVASQ